MSSPVCSATCRNKRCGRPASLVATAITKRALLGPLRPPLSDDAVLPPSALWTAEALGPAPLSNGVLALLFAAVSLQKGRQAQTILELNCIARHATSPASCDGANDINDLWREPDRSG